MAAHPAKQRRRSESGASAITVALMLAALGGFLALVINVGHLMVVRTQLQTACDSASLAGAFELDGTAEGLTRAQAKAADFAARHTTDRGLSVTIDAAADVEFGIWDRLQPRAAAFTPILDPLLVNAVRVQAGREGARSNPLEVFFTGFTGGQREASVTAEAVAVHGAPCDGCAVPLVFAECIIRQADGTLNCGQTLVFRSDTLDNIGFTNLEADERSVSTSGIIDILDGDCRSAQVGNDVGIGNGNNLNNGVINAFERFIARNGRSVAAPIASTPDGCGKFNGMQTVVGFARFTILGLTGPPDQSITIQLDCDQTIESRTAGCGFYGSLSPRPVLVR
ncbi:MAG: Tad domain-containing protein [Deltaproteobacteria bacterium]|nr:Tad domain-containing protein [Deltaproteobacteria bacterium]